MLTPLNLILWGQGRQGHGKMGHGAIEAGASATFPQQAMAARGAHQPHFPMVLALKV